MTVLLFAGCITPGGDDGGSAHDVMLTIDFEDFSPDTNPGKTVLWNRTDGGGWESVTEDRPRGTVYMVMGLEAGNVLEALATASDVTDVPVVSHFEGQGAFVDSIDGVENGQDGHYWSYYVNDEYGLVSADAANLDDGDAVHWVYMGNPFG